MSIAVLLARRRGCGQSLHQSCCRHPRQRLVTGKVLLQQIAVNVGVKLIDARAEPRVTDKPCAGILSRRLQIVDGGVEIILDQGAVGGQRMTDTNRPIC